MSGNGEEQPEDEELRMSPRRGRDGDYVVEAHDRIGDRDGAHGLPQARAGFHGVSALVLALDELEGDPEQEQAADDAQIGHAEQIGDREGEQYAKADRGAGAEQDAELALVDRQGPARHGDDDRVVPGQQEVDPDHLKQRQQECRGEEGVHGSPWP